MPNASPAGRLPVMQKQFTILVHTFYHSFHQEDRRNFFTRVLAQGWRPWLCRLQPTSPATAAETVIESYSRELRKLYHPASLEALFPEIHRWESCFRYYQDICQTMNSGSVRYRRIFSWPSCSKNLNGG